MYAWLTPVWLKLSMRIARVLERLFCVLLLYLLSLLLPVRKSARFLAVTRALLCSELLFQRHNEKQTQTPLRSLTTR